MPAQKTADKRKILTLYQGRVTLFTGFYRLEESVDINHELCI